MKNKPQVIYDMPHEEYLKIDALSSTAVKTINVSISDYIEEKKQDTSTPSKDLGRAYHKRILEGLDAFCDAYTTPFDKSEYLCTVDDLKSFLDDQGCTYKGVKSKADFEDLARQLGGYVYSDIIAQETREFLSQDDYNRICKFGKYLDQDLQGYKTEVTVLWDWDNVPCKARFDAVNETGIVDLKTFSNPNRISLELLPARMIANYRYDVQALFYVEAYKQARIIDKFFAAECPNFRFLWVQSQGGYNAMFTELQSMSDELYQANAYWQKALDDIEIARETYEKHILNSDTKTIFIAKETILEDHHLPTYHFQG